MRLFYILFFVLAKSYLNQLYIQSTISVVIFLGVGIEGKLSHLGSNSSEDMGNDNYNHNNIAVAKGLFFFIIS
jgi:hypothetical protein